MNSYLRLHSIVQVNYIFNNQQETVNIDSLNSIIVLKNIISLSKNIKFKNYNLYYNNKKIDEVADKMPIKTIISIDHNPIFFVNKKSDNPTNINAKSQSQIHNTHMEDIHSNRYNYILKLENFPSKQEVLDIVKNFMEKQNAEDKLSYLINLKHNQLTISFKKHVICLKLTKFLN